MVGDSDEEIEVEGGDNIPERCPITQRVVETTMKMVKGSCCNMVVSLDGALAMMKNGSQVRCPHVGCSGLLQRNDLLEVPHPFAAAAQGRAKRSRKR